jgi:hypothetical protein
MAYSSLVLQVQGGFRNKRTTVQDMDMMIMTIEDAHLFKQHIYLLQADMTQAFDTIDHDKLRMNMYNLGFGHLYGICGEAQVAHDHHLVYIRKNRHAG